MKQYIDYVKDESNEPSQEGLFTSTSDRNSSTDDEQYITIDSTLNETMRNGSKESSSDLQISNRMSFLEDDRKNTAHSVTVEPTSNRQTENIFMTEVRNSRRLELHQHERVVDTSF